MFKDNVILWESIREDVKRWVQKNWFQWQFDRPAWLTEEPRGHLAAAQSVGGSTLIMH